MCNKPVEHNVATFSELSLAVRWQGKWAHKTRGGLRNMDMIYSLINIFSFHTCSES